jgi:AmiR/NasT family two-component response regulator
VIDGPDSRYGSAVHEAAGMVSVQADCELEQAYVLLSDRATVSHIPLDDIACAVIDRSIRFD